MTTTTCLRVLTAIAPGVLVACSTPGAGRGDAGAEPTADAGRLATVVDARPLDAGATLDAGTAQATAAPPSQVAPACVDLPALPIATTRASAVRLADGRVLVSGGDDAAGRTTTRAWLLDLAARTVVATSPLPRPRAEHRSVVLRDGRVLVVGASHHLPLGKEPLLVFDPVHAAWKSVPTKQVIPQDAAVTVLPDGRALIAGGIVPDPSGRHQSYVELALLFDPTKNVVTVAPSLPQAGAYESNGVRDDHVELRGAAGESPGPGKMAVFDIAAGAWGFMDNGHPAPKPRTPDVYELDAGRLEILPAALRWCPSKT